MTPRLQELEDEYRDYLIESGDAPPHILRLTAQDFVTRNQDLAPPRDASAANAAILVSPKWQH